jgi:hypothetical protein
MLKALDNLSDYLIVMSLSMAGLKTLGHTPELSWTIVFAPIWLPAALIAPVVAAIVVLIAIAAACRIVVTLFTRSTPPKE